MVTGFFSVAFDVGTGAAALFLLRLRALDDVSTADGNVDEDSCEGKHRVRNQRLLTSSVVPVRSLRRFLRSSVLLVLSICFVFARRLWCHAWASSDLCASSCPDRCLSSCRCSSPSIGMNRPSCPSAVDRTCSSWSRESRRSQRQWR